MNPLKFLYIRTKPLPPQSGDFASDGETTVNFPRGVRYLLARLNYMDDAGNAFSDVCTKMTLFINGKSVKTWVPSDMEIINKLRPVKGRGYLAETTDAGANRSFATLYLAELWRDMAAQVSTAFGTGNIASMQLTFEWGTLGANPTFKVTSDHDAAAIKNGQKTLPYPLTEVMKTDIYKVPLVASSETEYRDFAIGDPYSAVYLMSNDITEVEVIRSTPNGDDVVFKATREEAFRRLQEYGWGNQTTALAETVECFPVVFDRTMDLSGMLPTAGTSDFVFKITSGAGAAANCRAYVERKGRIAF